IVDDDAVRGQATERGRDIVDVAAAGVVVYDGANGQLVLDQRQIDRRIDVAARIAVGRGRVTTVDIPIRHIQLRLVGDIAQHACLGASAEQCPLGALQDLDALEIRGVDVQVAAGQLAGLIVQIDRDVRERAYDAGSLNGPSGGRETAQVDVALPRPEAAR